MQDNLSDGKNVIYKDWWLAYQTTPSSPLFEPLGIETKYTAGFRDKGFKEFNQLGRPFEDFEQMMLESCVTATEFYELFPNPQMSISCQGGKYLVTYSPKSLKEKGAAVSFFLTREEMLRVKLTEEDTFPFLDKVIENNAFDESKNPGQMLKIPVLDEERYFDDLHLNFMRVLLQVRELIKNTDSNLYPSLSFHSNGKQLNFAQQLDLACLISTISKGMEYNSVIRIDERPGFYIGDFLSELFNSQFNIYPIFNNTDRMHVVASNRAYFIDDTVLAIDLGDELCSEANLDQIRKCIKKFSQIEDISTDRIRNKFRWLETCVSRVQYSKDKKEKKEPVTELAEESRPKEVTRGNGEMQPPAALDKDGNIIEPGSPEWESLYDESESDTIVTKGTDEKSQKQPPATLDKNGNIIEPNPYELDGACAPPFTFHSEIQEGVDKYNESVKQYLTVLDKSKQIVEPSPYELDGACAPTFTFLPEAQEEIDRYNEALKAAMERDKAEKSKKQPSGYAIVPADIAAALRAGREIEEVDGEDIDPNDHMQE